MYIDSDFYQKDYEQCRKHFHRHKGILFIVAEISLMSQVVEINKTLRSV